MTPHIIYLLTGAIQLSNSVAGLPTTTSIGIANPKQSVTPRDGAIDAFRYPMALLVVLLHSLPGIPLSASEPWGMSVWAVPIDAFTWCAVPFFFIVSGYYFREGRPLSAAIGSPLRKLIPIYLFWLALYIASDQAAWPNISLSKVLKDLPDGGWSAFHLWFLPALGVSIAVLAIADKIGGRVLVFSVAIIAAIFGPVLWTYHFLIGSSNTAIWLADVQRQLGAITYVCIGYLLKNIPVRSVTFSTKTCILAFVAVLIERLILVYIFHQYHVPNAQSMISTFVFGTAVFMLSRSLNNNKSVVRYASWGAISLAVYVCHIFYLRLLKEYLPTLPGRTGLLFIGTATLSTITAIILVRIPYLRYLSSTTFSPSKGRYSTITA